LETVDFLSGARASLPATASGFGRVYQLKQRLTRIIGSSPPPRLSAAGKLGVLALAVLLPFLPTAARPAAPPAPERSKADGAKPPAKPAARPPLAPEPTSYQNSSRPLFGVGGEVWCVAFSPDAQRLAVGMGADRFRRSRGDLAVWDLQSNKEIFTVGTEQPVRTLTWAPGGKTLATGEFDGTARIRDAATGRSIHVLRGHDVGVCKVAFTPDGKTLF